MPKILKIIIVDKDHQCPYLDCIGCTYYGATGAKRKKCDGKTFKNCPLDTEEQYIGRLEALFEQHKILSEELIKQLKKKLIKERAKYITLYDLCDDPIGMDNYQNNMKKAQVQIEKEFKKVE